MFVVRKRREKVFRSVGFMQFPPLSDRNLLLKYVLVYGNEFPTFREACYAFGLLQDDKEYIDAIEEASHSGSGSYLISTFSFCKYFIVQYVV
ncbi:hypothetical protein LXL04_014546 [Taraxacum kok-saghyz]